MLLGATLDANILLALIVSVAGGLLAVAAAGNRARHATVQIELDASRRWVTIVDVHPAFTDACDRTERQRDRSEAP